MCNRPLLSLLITFSLSYSRDVRTSHGRAFGAFGIGERSLFVSRAVNAERSLRFAPISTNWRRRPLLPSRRRPGIEYGHSRRRGDRPNLAASAPKRRRHRRLASIETVSQLAQKREFNRIRIYRFSRQIIFQYLAANCSISPLRIVVFADNSPCEVFSLALNDRFNGQTARISAKLQETRFFTIYPVRARLTHNNCQKPTNS